MSRSRVTLAVDTHYVDEGEREHAGKVKCQMERER